MRWLLLALTLFSCAPESATNYQTGETEEEVISLLNQREYSKVIWLMEKNKNLEGKTAFLLAEAYLGRAGLEPLEFAANITGPQKDSDAARKLFPNCPRDRLGNIKNVKMTCLLKRIYLLAPAADDGDMEKAKALMLKAYPDAATAPKWANTLIGLVETVSVVKRMGDVYLYAKSQEASQQYFQVFMDGDWLSKQGKLALVESKEALHRANYSSEKISQFLNGAKANQWFERLEGTLQYAKAVGISQFLDFARETMLKPADQIRYGEKLDRLKMVLDALDQNRG